MVKPRDDTWVLSSQ
ncbi:hypothetical protein ACFLK3_00740 [Rickettsia sibirica]